MIDKLRVALITVMSIVLAVFTMIEVNYGYMLPLSQLAVFALLGMGLCFLKIPLLKRFEDNSFLRVADMVMALAFAVCCAYLIYQGQSLSDRAGQYTQMDFIVGTVGIILVLVATQRSIGWTLPILSGLFLAYAYFGQQMPDWLFPHRGYGVDRIVAQTFLRTEGVFGTAMSVMFRYVFPFVVFGAFLEVAGCTQFIIDFAQLVFGRSPGGPAKVSVLGSGLMGSLSGSAVANAVTTGTFTIPMMRSAGFSPHVSGGITAAAASGGALVPPVMGAGAYMMLELVPNVEFLQIMKAAIIPAVLYYFSLLMIVHFFSRKVGATTVVESETKTPSFFEGLIFFGSLAVLIALLVMGRSPFQAVTYALGIIMLLGVLHPEFDVSMLSRVIALALLGGLVALNKFVLMTGGDEPATWESAIVVAVGVWLLIGLCHPQWRPIIKTPLMKSAAQGMALVAASGCVGIIIGVVTLTGVGTAFPNAIIPLAEHSLLAALVAIMVCSIVLGMGLPSAVCYLLMATLIGPVLNQLGVIPLAAHLFIFYFGMMSMVTPPVALAAYASASIADSNIIRTSFSAFQFALVGFALPFMFIYHPELLLMAPGGGAPNTVDVVISIFVAGVGVVSLAASIAGFLSTHVGPFARLLLFAAAVSSLFPSQWYPIPAVKLGISDIAGVALFIVVWLVNRREGGRLKAEG